MKQAKKLLAAFMAVVMMMSVMATAFAVSAEEVDPDAKQISGWGQVLNTATGGYFNDDFNRDYGTPVEATISTDFYTPVESLTMYYKGKCMDWKCAQLNAWVKDSTGYTSLDQFDGVCFFINVSEENKYDIQLRISGTSAGLYGYGINVEKGSDQFVYIPWDQFRLDGVADPENGKPQYLTKELVASCASYGVGMELMASKWNNTEAYQPVMDFTISAIYGYKTNGSEDVDDYTFYIPHEETVKNLPNYFADRIPHPDVAEKIDAAYKAALALKDKAAAGATQADVDLIQNFLDLYDSANTGTRELLAEQYGITKDPNADADSWYALDAVRQTFAEEIAYQESLKNQPTTPGGSTGTQAVAKKPAKVKKVTAKSKAKKKVVVTWKAAKNAKKYNVKYSYKKNMKKAKTVTVKKAKATIKKLKSGKKIYIQVRGVNGKVKGKWSAKKSVKVK